MGIAGAAPSVPDEGAVAATPGGYAADSTAAYGQLPIQFEANAGQTDAQVRFLARGRGYALFLSPSAATLSLDTDTGAAALRMEIVGGDQRATISGVDWLPGTANYLVGNDPASWYTNVSTFRAVRYGEIYPGIDLFYYGNDGALEYDFVVAPGADPRAIALDMTGSDHISVNAAGDLIVDVAGAEVLHRKPFIYQDIDGNRLEIPGRYVLTAERRVGFEVAAYDTTRPLVIDPVMEYSSFLGGSGGDGGNDAQNLGTAIAVDADGNAYITGVTSSTNFPTTVGAYDTTDNTGQDVFVTKLNAAGDALVYSTYLGGTGNDEGHAIAVDGAGNAYITGDAGSMFPITAGAFDTTQANFEPFVTKLNAAGNALVYSTFLGGPSIDHGYGIAVDADGKAYVTGVTYSTEFHTTIGAYDTTYNGGSGDGFVAKLNATGTALEYSTFLGGSGAENPFGASIALDDTGNAHVTGETASSNFPTTVGAFDTSFNIPGSGRDVFVTKLNATGTALEYSTYLGGTGDDRVPEIAIDATGRAVVAGTTGSVNFPTTVGAYDTTDNGSSDAFVTKVSVNGDELEWSTYLGGNNLDEANAVGINGDDKVWVTGSTVGSFPVTPDAFSTTGSFDAFAAMLLADGSSLSYSTYLGGSASSDKARAMAVDAFDNVYITGTTRSMNFPTTPGALDRSHNGGTTDFFVTKLNHIPFTDVIGTTFEQHIIWLYDAGITGGCNATQYCPNATVTRGQMAAFLSRALELPATSEDFFTDDTGTSFETHINRVAAAGIASGCTATTYCPNATITRGQMAAFLSRAFELPATDEDFFTDDNGTTFETHINRVAAAGIASGCTATTYCPNAPVTRGQMAAFLHRALDP